MMEDTVNEMQNIALKEQGRKMESLSERIVQLETKLAELTAQITTLGNIGKVLAIAAAGAIGIDVAQMGGI